MRGRLKGLTLFALLMNTSPLWAEEAPAIIMPSFADETKSSGINSVYAGDWQYMVGGGAAAFDCNGDAFPDLLLAGGEKPAKFYRNSSKQGEALRFVEEKSGLELDAMTGAYPIDVDSDGITDIVTLRVGEDVIFRGLGGCKFERANEAWNYQGGDLWSTAFAATWEKGATWPTLAVGSYIDRNEELYPWGSCTENRLMRPDATQPGRFAAPLPLKPSFCPLSMMFTDWNRSGTPSLRVSNDREYYKGGQEQMWKIDAGKPPALYTQAEGWRYLRIWGMGVASYDLDFNGYPEYFLTSMADNKLQALAEIPKSGTPKPGYADIAFKKGITAHRPYTGGDWHPSTAWHTEFQDVNNDGLVDLFIAKGNVAEMPDFALKDPNNLLVQKPDGTFEETGDKAGVASMNVARGASLADFNLDGLVDLVVVNRWVGAEVWRNTTRDAGTFLSLRLVQPGANTDAIGAWVEVKCGAHIMRREIIVGGGHAGGQLTWHHFGLGDLDKTEIRVTWPDGTAGPWAAVETGKFLVVARDKAPEVWTAQ